ncbi:YtxH domain-containing protein [Parachlamydia acanthamoebae]|jgi:gas vesicle protein|uniref:YtxH domain-containing protein n=1 Tax=Parachlamydia acanthamoebae TaxID=83552 RepID=UPI000750D47B|nr:YtxH domain-containing protein [Parachlamydia acanthamoebae]
MVNKIQEDFLWGTLIGTFLGAATALLLTPASGAKLRQKMLNQLNQINGKKTKHVASPRSRSTKALKSVIPQPKKPHRKHTRGH